MTEHIQEARAPRFRKERDTFVRRHFLSVAAWGGFFLSVGVGALGMLRFMFPRVLFEPSTSFEAGNPGDYVVGEVSEKFKLSERVWIIRENDGSIYALLANCTHLGCTPRWLASEDKFKCPCHGSGFRRSGVNFEGPAPRPLERVKIALTEEGGIVIDKAKRFRHEKGEWTNPEASLRI